MRPIVTSAPFRATTLLPYGRQSIGPDDAAAVLEVLQGPTLTTGRAVDAFEAAISAVTGAKFSVACSSGTAALHLAAMALELSSDDTVIVPAITFAATASSVLHTGAGVVLADVDPATGLMTEETLAAAIQWARTQPGANKVRAACPVHFAGQSCDMPALDRVAAEHGLTLIEDAAHAIGTRYASGPVERAVGGCRHAAMTTFSFHPVKTVTAGEGGAVTTNDAKLTTALRRLRNHGITREPEAFTDRTRAFAADGTANPWYYEVERIGLNYRLSDLHSALGTSQIAKLGRFVARRAALVGRYHQALAPLAPLVRPLARMPHCRPAWHLMVVRIDLAAFGLDRATVMRRLADRGVGSQVHYIPLHHLPAFQGRVTMAPLPGAEAYYQQALSLPLFPDMADDDVDRVVAALSESLGL